MYILGLNKTHNVKVGDVKQIRNLPNDLDVLKVGTLDVNKESNNILDGKLFLFECFIINKSSCFSGVIMVIIVWIYNCLCTQRLSLLVLWVWIPLRWGVLNTTLCDKVCQWLVAGQWFSSGTPVSSTNKTDRHDWWKWR